MLEPNLKKSKTFRKAKMWVKTRGINGQAIVVEMDRDHLL